SFLGYVSFIQAEHQLVSPLIPTSTVLQIAKHSIYASLPAAVLLLISLGFYFYQKRIVVIILSSLAIISYYVLSNTDLI
ncbi:hypothetical protein, partial [Ferruginibacter sp.]